MTPTDIANRACQHCGVQRISTTLGFAEDSNQASEIGACYDSLRRAELRRNVWQFSIRKAALRPINTTTMLLQPALWSSLTTYGFGAIVADAASYLWQSQTQNNLNNQPGNSGAWDAYFGPMTVDPYDTTGTTGYYAGELVYKTPGDGTYKVYMCLISGTSADPSTTTTWDSTVTYMKDDIVISSAIVYVSLVDFNLGHTPVSSPTLWTTTNPFGTAGAGWSEVAVGLIDLKLAYPLGTGPAVQAATRNIFRLPANFLRKAPQDPKAGSVSFLGAPSGLMYNDWDLTGNYIVSRESNPIVLRFVADIIDVSNMDDMFREGLAARIASEVVERLTQSTAKRGGIIATYNKTMGEARVVNGIETGPTEPPEDDYITCRI